MAKVGMIHRDIKRKKLNKGKSKKIAELKTAQRDLRKRYLAGEELTLEEMMDVQFKFQKQVPRAASKVRFRNRCSQTGRPRGFYRRFGICRNVLRELGSEGKLPGLRKASW